MEYAGDPGDRLEALKAFTAARGIAFEERDDFPIGTSGASYDGRVAIRSELHPAEKFKVLAHELAHELLHKGEDRESLSKTVRETEADAVAYAVSSAIGLEGLTATSDYIQLYSGDRDTLCRSLTRIRSTTHEILEGIKTTDAEGPKEPKQACA